MQRKPSATRTTGSRSTVGGHPRTTMSWPSGSAMAFADALTIVLPDRRAGALMAWLRGGSSCAPWTTSADATQPAIRVILSGPAALVLGGTSVRRARPRRPRASAAAPRSPVAIGRRKARRPDLLDEPLAIQGPKHGARWRWSSLPDGRSSSSFSSHGTNGVSATSSGREDGSGTGSGHRPAHLRGRIFRFTRKRLPGS